jgi:hypothetical protein
MKLSKVLLVIVNLPQLCLAQGTFQNLDFEDANPVLGNGVSTLMPGWEVFIGNSSTSTVGYDALSLGAPAVTVWDDKTGYSPLQGNYTAFLQSATVPIVSESVSLSQTGVVPNGSQSIELEANEEEDGAFTVSLGSDNITMFPLRSFSSYTVYGGNVSAWAGQDTTLTITQLAPLTPNQEFSPSLLQLDDIMFSPTAVTPEPSAISLMGIGGALFAAYRRFASKRQ